MKLLTPEEVSKWIAEVGQVEDPHHAHLDDIQHLLHTQFTAPSEYRRIECFVRQYLTEVVGDGDLLVHLVADYPPSESDMFLIDSFLKAAGEKRDFWEVPGFLFAVEEKEHAIVPFTLMSCFGWQCNLHANHDQLTLFNWEGAIYDAWTTSAVKMKALQNIIQRFGFKPVADE